MTGFVVHRIDLPASPDAAPHSLVEATVALDRLLSIEGAGHDDYVEDAAAWSRKLADRNDRIVDYWVAVASGVDPDVCRPDDALGFALVELSLVDDLEIAEVWVGVRPQARRHGIGNALFAAASEHAVAYGRTLLVSWMDSPVVQPDDPRALAAASGSGVVDADLPPARWLSGHGFVLEQVERPALLVLGDRPTLMERLTSGLRTARAKAGEAYEIVGWQGPTPTEHVAGLAQLRRGMSADVPTAGLPYAEQTWDADRVRERDALNVAMGRDCVVATVRHVPTGALVGYSYLAWPVRRPAGVWQVDTFVASEHRGRGLALALKCANLLRLLDANPAAARVHTGNADENQRMRAINEALGFTGDHVEGVWQKRG